MKIFEKILYTIMLVGIALFGLSFSLKFYIGYTTMDDDIIFIYGMCFVVFVSILNLIRMITFDIYVIWYKKKKVNTNNKKSKESMK